MGISTHKRAVMEVVDRMMAESQEARECLYEYQQKLHAGLFSQSHVDAILQKWNHSGYDIYDAYAFSRVHSQLCSGSIVSARVDISAMPRGDKEIEYHNSVLNKRESRLFFGEFWGGLADSDGYLTWVKPLEFEVGKCILDDDTIERKSVLIKPRRVPLEVGTTEGSRTIVHLGFDGGLARWPYGSEEIHVYVVIDDSIRAGHQLDALIDD